MQKNDCKTLIVSFSCPWFPHPSLCSCFSFAKSNCWGWRKRLFVVLTDLFYPILIYPLFRRKIKGGNFICAWQFDIYVVLNLFYKEVSFVNSLSFFLIWCRFFFLLEKYVQLNFFLFFLISNTFCFLIWGNVHFFTF